MAIRYYSSVAAETTLVGGISAVNTTMQVGSVAGLPIQYPYTMAVDYEGLSEELVSVTNAAGTTLTITRAIDGTSASTHNSGARVRHVSSAQDFRESREHEEADTNVHGLAVGSAVIGETDTQTLSNKTLDMAEGTLSRIDIFNEGNGIGWVTTVNGDAAFPTTNLMAWKPDVLANDVATINSNGGYIVRNKVAGDATTNEYRFRATKSDGTTDIAYILNGGTVKTFTTDGQSGFTVQPRGVTVDARAFSLRNTADSADVFTVWNNGRVDVVAQDPASSLFDITGAAAQSGALFRIQTSALATIFTVAASNKMSAVGTADIKNDNHSNGVSEPVLRVFARQPGQTGDLTQWVDSSNVIRARVFADGTADFNSTLTTTGIITAASGWSVVTQEAVEKAGIMTVVFALQRTGANITAGATGNITDTDVGTIAAAFRPSSLLAADTMTTAGTTGSGDGSVRLTPTTGLVEVVAWSSGGAIVTNEFLRFTYTYVT